MGPPATEATQIPVAIRPDQPVSLVEAVQIAYQNHANIAVAEEAVEAARQRIRQVRTGTLPQIIGEVSYSGRGTSNLGGIFGARPTITVPGGPGQPPRRQVVDTNTVVFDQGLQPRVGLNYSPYDGGLTRAAVRQARAGLERDQANLLAVRNTLEFLVSANFIQQLRAERLLELRRAQVELAETQLQEVEERIRVEAAAEADRVLPLSELRNRQVDLILAQNDVRVTANALRNVMGLPVGPPLQLVPLREVLPPLLPLESLREMALRERPEVVQAEAQARVAQTSVSIARIGRKPRVDSTFAFDLTPANEIPRSTWVLGVSVSMPIWDAGLTHAREQEAKTGVSAALARLEQTKKDVLSELEEAYLNLVNARERLAAARLALEAAETNLRVTTERFRLGIRATTVDLIQAQVQFANASNAVIQALFDLHLAQADLDRAVGR